MHLAEVYFYKVNATCPPHSILNTTESTDTDTETPPEITEILATTETAPKNTETAPMKTETVPMKTETALSTITVATIIMVVFIIVIIVVVTIIVVVICVRAKSSRRKINTTISGEGHTAGLGHPYIDDSQSKFSLCEETGQVYYSTVLSKKDDSLDEMYSQVQEAPVKSNHPRTSNVDDDDDPADPRYDHIQRYSQEDIGRSCHLMIPNKDDLMDGLSNRTSVLPLESDALYSVVNKPSPPRPYEKNETCILLMKSDEVYSVVNKPSPPQPYEKKETDALPMESDAVYSVVNKPSPPQAYEKKETGVLPMESDAVYSVVNKPSPPQAYEKKETGVLPMESDAVYSVVNKPSPPAIPKKSDLLMEDEFYSHLS